MIVNLKELEINEEYYNQIIKLYSEFGNIDTKILDYKKLNNIISNLSNNHNIFFYIDNNVIYGAITLIIEQKFIHNGGKVGHIEDFVVLEEHRKKRIGSLLMNYAIQLSEKNNCYKIILDTNPILESFYNKYRFKNKGMYMGLYF
tara:strand:+ start:231 stop:665 length:435 start_codon:yes stop_codon:yes gene_type:complete